MLKPGPNLKYGTVILVVVFAIATAGIWGLAELVDHPKAAAVAQEESPAGGPVSVTVVAKNTSFDKKSITASPGVDVTVTFDNQDAGVLHNIAFYTTRAASQKIVVGSTITGPAKEDVTFKAPDRPGNYFFRCDVHPDQMTGALIVK